MSIGFLLFGIIISVIAAIATLILAIISLSTGKQRNGLIFGVAFVMSLVLSVLCILNIIERGANKVKQGINWVQHLDEKNKSKWNYDKYGKEEKYYGFIPEGNKDTIASSFYSSSEKEMYYIPLVFPYRFASQDRFMSFGSLEKMQGTTSMRPSEGDSCFNQLQYISSFRFDDKLLLAKRDNKELRRHVDAWKKKDIPDFTYILFDFTTGKCQSFWSEETLNEEAEKRGFHGKKYMDLTTTHYFSYSETEED